VIALFHIRTAMITWMPPRSPTSVVARLRPETTKPRRPSAPPRARARAVLSRLQAARGQRS